MMRITRNTTALCAVAALAAVELSCGASKSMPRMAAEAAPEPAAMDVPGADRMAQPPAHPQQPPPQPAMIATARPSPAADLPPGAGDGEWAVVRQFPVPDYSEEYDGPRNDFRETVYWNPAVRTDASGRATVSFYLSDSITSFRATAEGLGGAVPGRGEALIASKLPVSLAAKLPLEVSRGDVANVPVTLTNTTTKGMRAALSAEIGAAFRMRGDRARRVWIPAGRSKTIHYELNVVGDGVAADEGRIAVAVEAAGMRDSLERVIRVSPPGFPQQQSVAGTLRDRVEHELVLPEVVPGTARAELKLYPSPIATMVDGTEAIIREPHGCFEQASSANYPNVMVMRYLAANDADEPELVARTKGVLDRGYTKLVGYESASRGYEWFGADPGHEALTAYGLMQFTEMAEVHDVDAEMLARTKKWLLSRRDGTGRYELNPKFLHTWAYTDATHLYITYALVHVGVTGLDRELAFAADRAGATSDPYELALAAAALAEAGDSRAAAAADRLAGMQGEDGSFPGATESVTKSGGQSLLVETTALATIALVEAKRTKPAQRAIDWLVAQRSGGGFGSTQATVLALAALTRHSQQASLPAGVRVSVHVNGSLVDTIALGSEQADGISVPDLSEYLRPGANRIELRASEPIELPYSAVLRYRVRRSASSPDAAVRISTALRSRTARVGKPVTLRAMVRNVTDAPVPMTLARVGIPGGLTYQTWQLDELVERGEIDFYETREREVILYFRSLGANERKRVSIELLAAVPGRYTAPPSTAYLYYTDEHKHWADPVEVAVWRPWRPRRKHATR